MRATCILVGIVYKSAALYEEFVTALFLSRREVVCVYALCKGWTVE